MDTGFLLDSCLVAPFQSTLAVWDPGCLSLQTLANNTKNPCNVSYMDEKIAIHVSYMDEKIAIQEFRRKQCKETPRRLILPHSLQM